MPLMMSMDASEAAGPRRDWHDLQDRVAGTWLPGTNEYERMRKPVGQRFHHVRPEAVVHCRSSADAVEAVAFARRSAVPVAIRSGGHDLAGRSTTTGMVIDLSGLNDISIDGHRAAVGAGARLGDVYRALDQRGRTLPAGCGLTVGIAGLTLGGGLGVLGRKHGLLCDQLIAAEVVLADGRTVSCDAERHADLFWALRGGGAAGVGIVTQLVFETVPAPSCTVFRSTWRHAEPAVIDAWQRWLPDTPDAVAASLLAIAPADPSQAPFVTLFGSAAGISAGETGDLLGELTALADVAPDEHWQQEAPWSATKAALAAHGPGDDDGHLFSRSEFFREAIPQAVVGDLVELLNSDRRPGEAQELDFSPWGGGYNRTEVTATAFPHRKERFLLKHGVTVKTDPEHRRPRPSGWLDQSWETVHPYGSGGAYPNFPDPILANPELAYYGPNLDRLHRIKADYDPTGVFPSAAVFADIDAG
jgi:FAD/FMN-containing dehydrogenase